MGRGRGRGGEREGGGGREREEGWVGAPPCEILNTPLVVYQKVFKIC